MPDITYNRPNGRKRYLSIGKHQSVTRNRFSKWISINVERDCFDYADYGNYTKTPNTHLSWTCANGNMWSIKQDRSAIGVDNEQFGFFQCPVNPNDEWHGYPVVPFSQERLSICDLLLQRWVAESIIDIDDIPMIIKKKRI